MTLNDVDIGWAESAVNQPRLTVDGLGRGAPASNSCTNRRWCAVMAIGPPELQPDPRSPLDPRLRDGPTPPQPALVQLGPARHELAWSWHGAGTTGQEWTCASTGSEAVVWARWGSPRGVSTFEKVWLAFCAARLRSSLATLWLRE